MISLIIDLYEYCFRRSSDDMNHSSSPPQEIEQEKIRIQKMLTILENPKSCLDRLENEILKSQLSPQKNAAKKLIDQVRRDQVLLDRKISRVLDNFCKISEINQLIIDFLPTFEWRAQLQGACPSCGTLMTLAQAMGNQAAINALSDISKQ